MAISSTKLILVDEQIKKNGPMRRMNTVERYRIFCSMTNSVGKQFPAERYGGSTAILHCEQEDRNGANGV